MPTAFTPFQSAAGGVLIGSAAVLLLLLHGRILGATGILSGVLRPAGWSDWRLRVALVAGMVAAPAVVAFASAWPAIDIPVGRGAIIVGGLLVGAGAAVGGGCTSGHGVCGLARFSRRSAVATATFMASAFATVFIVRHGLGG